MEDIKLNLNDKGRGAFVIMDGEEQLAEMALSISGGDLIVYHTEVAQKAEGKGLAKNLLNEMVSYARKHGLKVVALCPYVHAQFKRHPEEFEDIWKKSKEDL
ncbi:GNAT family N-acetyltransferase [Pedobacter sp. LMG 31464]|uniref:GNAT family N-acetyltransferase n=1 Tax=Pedobacter planticolens TaxID=2679964 RepID=A0A923DXA4_9SPHI|nr:GNAT family N-acetyltransferase [Pedobacter planticolens]MBB2145712.1 GNAT family N-acetyltransferase [Pedobacter planticolens]